MSSSIFSSNTSQQKWAEKLNDNFIVYVKNSPSIFQVPKSISDTNPEAYAPQEIGIGPYHHFRRDLDDMESIKFAAIKTFLKPEQFHNFKSLVVDKMRAMEPSIRSCYDKYLDLDSDALAWAMAIDGVFLLHLFSKGEYRTWNGSTGVKPDGRKLAQDVWMMENQFPIIVLNEIRKVLCAQASGNSTHALLMQEARGRGNKDISDLPEVEESDDDCTESDDDKLASLQQQEEASGSCNMPDLLLQLQQFKVQKVGLWQQQCGRRQQGVEGGGNEDISELPEFEELDDVYLDESEARREELFFEMLSICRLHSPLELLMQEARGRGNKDISEMLSICRLHSPLDDTRDTPENSPHILGLMYRLVVLTFSPRRVWRDEIVGAAPDMSMQAAPAGMKEVAAELIGLKPLELIENLPWEEFLALFRNPNSTTNSSIEEIQIPSVSQLRRVSRIQFEKSTSGGAVRYDRKRRKLYLPVMRLNTDSEVILRNLVAYELALGSNANLVSSYVDLMCGLIDTAKDVDLLKEKGIIITALPSEEVAKMFNGINKSSGMVSSLEMITQDLNEAYDSSFRVRCFRFLKNYLIPSKNSVKLVLWILMVSLLVLQAFCQIYGCSEHWFSSK